MLNTDLTGKRAAVTAGANGLGLVIAETLKDAGADVYVCDIDPEAINSLPSGLTGTVVDVSDPDLVDGWLLNIVKDGIDILINNAGISGPTAAIEDISTEDWQTCLRTNLDAMFLCSGACPM